MSAKNNGHVNGQAASKTEVLPLTEEELCGMDTAIGILFGRGESIDQGDPYLLCQPELHVMKRLLDLLEEYEDGAELHAFDLGLFLVDRMKLVHSTIERTLRKVSPSYQSNIQRTSEELNRMLEGIWTDAPLGYNPKLFAQRLHMLRTDIPIGQAELGAKVGLGAEQIDAFEHGPADADAPDYKNVGSVGRGTRVRRELSGRGHRRTTHG